MDIKDCGMEIEMAALRLLEYADDHKGGAFSRDVRRETLVIMAQLAELEKAFREEMVIQISNAEHLVKMAWEAEKARRPWNRMRAFFKKLNRRK